jgi:hypothetical protein
MQFVNPLFLFGLFAVAIPVVIHLFNFRRFRKIYFTNVRFLNELKQQTRKQSQLRHLLILAMRILAVASLVFAFAQPYLPFKQAQNQMARQNAVSIYVDNSFSMEATGTTGTLLDEAKEKAREIVSAYKTSDLFQLLTSDFEGRHQRLVTRDEFLTQLSELKISPSVRSFPEILRRQYDLLQSSPASNRTTYMLSDFQRSSFGTMDIQEDSAVSSFLVPLRATSQSNVYVDTCWFSQPTQQPGKTCVLTVRVQNKSENDLEKIPLKLLINGQQKSVAGIDIRAGQQATVEMPFTVYEAGPQQGELQVTDYPVTYDDPFYFSFDVLSSIRVLAINGGSPNRYLTVLFGQDSSVLLTNISEKSIDFGLLRNTDLVVLNEIPALSSGMAEELFKFVSGGGTMLVLPAANQDLVSLNRFLVSLNAPSYLPIDTADTRVVRVSEANPLFRDVFENGGTGKTLPENTQLPKVSRYFPLVSTSSMVSVPLMVMLNGRDFLTLTPSGQGQILQSAVPLDPSFSDFPLQALFVPVLYNMALISHPTHDLYSIIGDNRPIRAGSEAPAGDRVFRIKSRKGDFDVIPQVNRNGNMVSLFVGNLIPLAGNYDLRSEDALLSTLSFNYDRKESDLSCLTAAELENRIGKARLHTLSVLKTGRKPLNEVIAEINSGTPLWKYFIVLALLFLLAEVLLIRFFKK